MANEGESLLTSINETIEQDIRPFIEADGGKIELRGVEDGIVFVKLSGACAHCPGAAMTLRGGVERIIRAKFQEIKGVELAY